MANKCAICGAEINLVQTQKLADGNCICRKNCRSKGMKAFDYVHANLPSVQSHLEQVDRGTKLWEYFFVPRLKTKNKAQKLKRFGGHLYVAEDIGLVAFTQVDYKFFLFGKSTRACVYRIADLRAYKFEKEEVRNGDKTEKKEVAHLAFINTPGLYEVFVPMNNVLDFEKLKKYFDSLFGIQKTLGNAMNNWKKQMDAVKDISVGFNAAVRGDADMAEKAEQAMNSLDAAIYGDRTEWIRRADEALAEFDRQAH